MKTRKELAEAMRMRQIYLLPETGPKLGLSVSKIESLSDDLIIESYIAQSKGGEKQVPLHVVDQILGHNPNNLDEFFEWLEAIKKAMGTIS